VMEAPARHYRAIDGRSRSSRNPNWRVTRSRSTCGGRQEQDGTRGSVVHGSRKCATKTNTSAIWAPGRGAHQARCGRRRRRIRTGTLPLGASEAQRASAIAKAQAGPGRVAAETSPRSGSRRRRSATFDIIREFSGATKTAQAQAVQSGTRSNHHHAATVATEPSECTGGARTQVTVHEAELARLRKALIAPCSSQRGRGGAHRDPRRWPKARPDRRSRGSRVLDSRARRGGSEIIFRRARPNESAERKGRVLSRSNQPAVVDRLFFHVCRTLSSDPPLRLNNVEQDHNRPRRNGEATGIHKPPADVTKIAAQVPACLKRLRHAISDLAAFRLARDRAGSRSPSRPTR